jgi:hypothetical protein
MKQPASPQETIVSSHNDYEDCGHDTEWLEVVTTYHRALAKKDQSPE